GMNFPSWIDPIGHLGADAGRVRATLGVEYRQPRRHRLHGVDAKIGRGRFRAFPGEAWAGRDREPLNHRHDEIRREVGNDARVTANTLAEFAARAEPVDRIVFNEAAELDRGFDVAEAIQ